MEFELNKYLGKWYEVARIKNFFEPDLINVTALYKLPRATIHTNCVA